MRMPPIAPLNHREARVARDLLATFRKTVADHGMPEAHLTFMTSVIAQLEAAVADYDARGWLQRRLPPVNPHRVRLRSWMLELRGYALREYDES